MDDKTRELLELLAMKLGVKAQELSEHLVNYTYMCGLMIVIAGGVLFFLTVLLGVFSYIAFKREERDIFSVLVLCSILAGVLGMLFFLTGLPAVLEPVGATIKALL